MLNDSSLILFCQCATIPKGGFCAKHNYPNEEDRLRRRASAEAFDRLTDRAKSLGGWHKLEDLIKK